jgi:L-alanine-DL-glutamate epimerase-like enolase superfamily enzyme
MPLPTDIGVTACEVRFEPFSFRTPLVLSTGPITGIEQATAIVRVEDRAGRLALGYGTVFLSDLWAWPSARVAGPDRQAAMRSLCESLAAVLPGAMDTPAHPLEHGIRFFAHDLDAAALRVTDKRQLVEPMPHLAAAVCFSPFDAALHDAFGRLHGIDAWRALDRALLPAGLDRWLGPSAAGRHLGDCFRSIPEARVPGWHLVSKGDALTRAEVGDALGDGLPESLEEWIEAEGVHCLKVKTSGTDVAADVARTVDVYRVAEEVHARIGTDRRVYLEVDSNEVCPSAEVVVEYLERLREASAEAFDALLFVEQPTGRDLAARPIDMRAVAAIKPVLIDEGLQTLGSLEVAESLGWSGAALKTCKGHSFTLLCIAWCELHYRPYAIVDLTNPGLGAVHSAVLASRCRPMMGLELNCRQFVPAANAGLATCLPGLARMRDGAFDLAGVVPLGLGCPDALLPLPTAPPTRRNP